MAIGTKSEFQGAVNSGYYFDRGIDLEFYDSSRKLLGKLTTPKQGMKPSITVKGTLIEGSYAINSYVSVQNLAYNINVNAVEHIKCTIYYAGLKESNANVGVKYGHSFLFSVLYADQEKEPPNRAVRFQCTVAAYDFAARAAEIDIKDGSLSLSKSGTPVPKAEGKGKKTTPTKEIIKFLKELADTYNNLVDEGDRKAIGRNVLRTGELTKIRVLRYPKILKGAVFSPPTTRSTIKGVIDSINTIQLGKDVKNFNGGTLKVAITPGVLSVDIIPPSNWDEQMKKNGVPESNYISELIKETYKDVYEENIDKDARSVDVSSSNSPVKLNYVKSAYRNEITITCTTMYDDRIRAGCYCVIAGNAIMGKHAARSSRLIKLPGQKVLFRATGSIEYEFSTTEDSFMTISGPVVDEDYRETKEVPNINR